MTRSVQFYKKLGFELLYGRESAAFSSLKADEAFVNLSANPGYEHSWWGRVIFRVVDVVGEKVERHRYPLLTDTKRREDPIQDVVRAGSARDPIDRPQRGV